MRGSSRTSASKREQQSPGFRALTPSVPSGHQVRLAARESDSANPANPSSRPQRGARAPASRMADASAPGERSVVATSATRPSLATRTRASASSRPMCCASSPTEKRAQPRDRVLSQISASGSPTEARASLQSASNAALSRPPFWLTTPSRRARPGSAPGPHRGRRPSAGSDRPSRSSRCPKARSSRLVPR